MFRHDALHEGASVVQGTKYIMRTEVLFWRVPNALYTSPAAVLLINEALNIHPANVHIANMYEKSEVLAEARHSDGFVKSYLSALDLQHALTQQPLDSEVGTNCSLLKLPPQLIVKLLLFFVPTPTSLSDRSTSPFEALASVSRCCRLLYRVSRSCGVWRVQVSDTTSGNPPLLEGDEGGVVCSVAVDWYRVAKGLSSDVDIQSVQRTTTVDKPAVVAMSAKSYTEAEIAKSSCGAGE